ncbi:Epimerase domain-containing protein [Cephalotus follicularis]|uniref:Epimerase domain-containing protein n=1 Tax=Cephalotus follicularis TaxID=3775 RepID=A0A1Q3CYS5_CEPFO|nr:Epimerase domain-containing protein [Cephalotus follicularis]
MGSGEAKGKVVCVTGASGYIASWLVKSLLQRGYTVKATVRDPNDPKKTEHLRALDGASERLHLFRAHLMEEGAFDSAVAGCDAVIHTASPVNLSVDIDDPQVDLIDPAVKGTLNVLRSCSKVPSIKKVVVTSSMAAVLRNKRPLGPDVVVDETWFSDPDFCRESKSWYYLSKTLAEEAALKFAKENGIDLVAINPGYVIGPLLQPTLNVGVGMIFNIINGQAFLYPYGVFVDIRDVANAHIQALEIPSASGRYCLVESVVDISAVLKILHEVYPALKLPEISEDTKLSTPLYAVSKEKVNSLGINFISFEKRKRMDSGEAKGKVVCVTGASGYIASWLVKSLLQRGYTIKATVRDPNDPKKTEHLRALDGASERLHLFRAHLMEEGAFDSAVAGCDAVIHTASPVILSVDIDDPQVDLIDPAVKGTLNVLRSCSKVPSIKRVVVTSSMAAVICNKRPLGPDIVVDETWFSDPDFCKESKFWYYLSKTLADEAAQKFAKESGIDLVTINPGYVIGPLLQPTLNVGVEMIFNIINGQTFLYPYGFFVDIRDVAYAHIQALEIPSASGRYCLVESVVDISAVLKILHEVYPALKLPEICEDTKLSTPLYLVSKEKAKSLGINFISLESSLVDTVESLKVQGFLSF